MGNANIASAQATTGTKLAVSGERPPARRVFLFYAILLGVLFLVPWSGWFGGAPLLLFRDYVNYVDLRENLLFASLLVGIVASITGLVEGRFAPVVPAIFGGVLFLAAGEMNFGAFSGLTPFLCGTQGTVLALLLCVVAAGMRSVRRHRVSRLAIGLAAAAGLMFLLLAGLSIAIPLLRCGVDWQDLHKRLLDVPPPFLLGGISVSHGAAIAVSASLGLAALTAAEIQCLGRGRRTLWAALAEALAKAALLVSAGYALAMDLARARRPDFSVILLFRWELSSAVFLLLLIDGLAELMHRAPRPEWMSPAGQAPEPRPSSPRSA